MSDVVLGDTVYFHFGTSSPSTGAATDADSTPAVTVEEDGVAMGYAPTVTNVATGLYRVTVVATAGNGFEAGKRYSGYAVATVGGVAGRDGIFEFGAYTRGRDDLAYPATSGRSLAVEADGMVYADAREWLGTAPLALSSQRVQSLVGAVSAGAIDAAAIATGAIDADALAADAVDEILDEVIEGTLTFRQALRLFVSSLAGKSAGGGTASITFRDIADAKPRITATVDANGNRTAVTLDGA